jgi:hypothetical protein
LFLSPAPAAEVGGRNGRSSQLHAKGATSHRFKIECTVPGRQGFKPSKQRSAPAAGPAGSSPTSLRALLAPPDDHEWPGLTSQSPSWYRPTGPSRRRRPHGPTHRVGGTRHSESGVSRSTSHMSDGRTRARQPLLGITSMCTTGRLSGEPVDRGTNGLYDGLSRSTIRVSRGWVHTLIPPGVPRREVARQPLATGSRTRRPGASGAGDKSFARRRRPRRKPRQTATSSQVA